MVEELPKAVTRRQTKGGRLAGNFATTQMRDDQSYRFLIVRQLPVCPAQIHWPKKKALQTLRSGALIFKLTILD